MTVIEQNRPDLREATVRAHLVRYAAHASGGRWTPWQHLCHIGNIISAALAKGNARIIVNMPPRHGKSELVSFWLPIWLLDLDPTKRIILTAYEAGFASDWGRRVRNEITSNEFCGVALAPDSHAASRWNTPEGGGMITAGIGGPISGRGFNVGILDDPHKNWAEAQSLTLRNRVRDWFDSTFYTRCEPNASIIVLMTRWHENDLTGYLLKKEEPWTHINLPALAERDDPLQREPNEALCAERFSAHQLTSIRRGVGGVVFDSMYQGNPNPAGVGRAYGSFQRARNLDAGLVLDPALPLHVAIDFNWRPHMHAVIGQYDEVHDQFIAVDEIASDEVRTSRELGPAIVDWIEKGGGWRWPELQLFGDATGGDAGRQSAVGVSDFDVLVGMIRARLPHVEIYLRTLKGNPRVPDRLNAFNEVMYDVEGTVRYRVHPRCKTLIRDFEEVRRDDSGLIDKSDPILTHASDAEGYRIHYLRPAYLAAVNREKLDARFSL